MQTFVDYTFYSTVYLSGAIPSSEFAGLALRASAEIEYQTLYRAGAVITAATDTATIADIKLATCAVAEVLKRYDAQLSTPRVIKSESVGDVSRNYSGLEEILSQRGTEIMDAFRKYLLVHGLLYRGL